MSTPYQPRPRKLERSRSNRIVGGVCGGVASYLNMDPNLVRILTVVLTLFTGIPIVVYLIALFLLPEEDPGAPPPYVNGPQPQESGYGPGQYGASPYPADPYATEPYGQSAGGAAQFTGPYTDPGAPASPYYPSATPGPGPATGSDEAVWGTEGPPWEQRTPTAQPYDEPSDQPAQQPVDEAEPTPEAPQGEELDAPATAAPDQAPATQPDPEPVTETETPEAPQGEESSWESAPADPADARSETTGVTPPSGEETEPKRS